MGQLKLYCYGVEVRLQDDAGLGLIEDLQSSLPPEFAVQDGSSPTVVDYVVSSDGGLIADAEGEYVVGCNGRDVFATGTDEEVLDWLRHDIHLSVARLSTEFVFVHAAVVGWRGLAIVIPGRDTFGKSTLAAELVRRGGVYYSDLFAAFDDEARVHGTAPCRS